jgi:hypothetical protein
MALTKEDKEWLRKLTRRVVTEELAKLGSDLSAAFTEVNNNIGAASTVQVGGYDGTVFRSEEEDMQMPDEMRRHEMGFHVPPVTPTGTAASSGIGFAYPVVPQQLGDTAASPVTNAQAEPLTNLDGECEMTD